ncbi:MAG: hypothetical protein KBB11_06990 [Bacteroidales bacterium]|nr:hypothetical protein [Bacteroidales bacterium]
MLRIYVIIVGLLMIDLTLFSQSEKRYSTNRKHLSLKAGEREYYAKNLPDVVDNSEEIYFPPIYTQTHWVCNQSAASYYMYTYEHNRVKNIASTDEDAWFSVYYPWNWFHGGYGWNGGHVTGTFNIGKNMGLPYLYQSPADLSRDSSIWVSGYDNYLSFMQNRIKDYYYIDVSDEAGLLMLKAWVYDHGRGEMPGGMATFMTNIGWGGDNYLPQGTPEAGYYTITKCGDNPLHSRTVVGYNDNICWDYNNDGQYTNNIDLNDDGVINVRDYEKGGFKLAESFGPEWQGHGGYLYIMYKCLADEFPLGGILNNEMIVIEPWPDYQPKYTAKIKLNHEYRGKVKLSIGISTNPEATTPDYEMDFPTINYQGGNNYMKGGETEDDKYFEIGYDLERLLSYMPAGHEFRLFLIGREIDPNNGYNGSIQEFTIYDYTSEPETSFTWTGNVPFVNGIISIPLNLSLDFDKPAITTESLPIFSANTNFNYNIASEGGTLPFTWSLEAVCNTTTSAYTYDYYTDTKLSPETYFDSIITVDLPFQFPYNGETYNKIIVHTDGYIMVGNDQFPWPYAKDFFEDFIQMERVIGPHMRFDFVCNPAYNDGIWLKDYNDHISIRWNVSQQYLESWTDNNFGLSLYENGKIDFFYGSGFYIQNSTGVSAVSYGNDKDYFIIKKDEIPQSPQRINITLYPTPENIQISDNGVLSGNIAFTEPYPIRVCLTDDNNITCKKDYSLLTDIMENDSEEIHIYPNPSDTYLVITGDKADSISAITLVNANGKQIDSYSFGFYCKFSGKKMKFTTYQSVKQIVTNRFPNITRLQ